jgi:hypothetical protein
MQTALLSKIKIYSSLTRSILQNEPKEMTEMMKDLRSLSLMKKEKRESLINQANYCRVNNKLFIIYLIFFNLEREEEKLYNSSRIQFTNISKGK